MEPPVYLDCVIMPQVLNPYVLPEGETACLSVSAISAIFICDHIFPVWTW